MTVHLKDGNALWLAGHDVYDEDREEAAAHEIIKQIMPVEYVKAQLNALEDAVNDLRRQTDGLRDKIKEMRNLISEDDF